MLGHMIMYDVFGLCVLLMCARYAAMFAMTLHLPPLTASTLEQQQLRLMGIVVFSGRRKTISQKLSVIN